MQKATRISMAAIIFIVLLIHVSSAEQSHALDLQGYWRSDTGNVIRIQGDTGILVDAADPAWQPFLDKPVISNIQPQNNQWSVKERVKADDVFQWVDIIWRIKGEKITKDLLFLTDEENHFYERIEGELSAEESKALATPEQNTKGLPLHQYHIGVDTRFMNYDEDDFMEEEGWMYGIAGGYTYHGKDNVMFDASAGVLLGGMDYDGQRQDGTPLQTDTDDFIFEGRLLVGRDYQLRDTRLIVTPFAGIGHRYWNDDIKGYGGYERAICYWYLPLGLKTIHPMIGGWTWGLNMEYDLFLSGQVKSDLGDFDPSFNEVKNSQDFGDGHGIRFSLAFHTRLSENYGLYIEPYMVYWDINESNPSYINAYGVPIGIGFEPDNKSTAVGVRASITFKHLLTPLNAPGDSFE